MVVDINKIIIKDRIRKDFGDIQELADDIKANGLINPPVVNKDYVLLAGERRVRACKLLGWNQIEVRVMDTNGEEHDLEVEISENEVRKDFSKEEREAIYTRKVQMRINSSGPIGPDKQTAENQVAEELGTSRTNMRREQAIVKNKHLLDPSDFADWDEGRLSTNKAFQKVKAELDRAKAEKTQLSSDNRNLVRQLDEAKKNVKVKEVKVEVVPEDYEETKKQLRMYKGDNERLNKENRERSAALLEANRTIRELREPSADDKLVSSAVESMDHFAIATYEYIRKYGGYVWAFEKWNDVPKETRDNFTNAIVAISGFAQQMANNVGGLT